MRFAFAFLLIIVAVASVIAAPSDSSPHHRAVRQVPSSGFDPSGSLPGGDAINAGKDTIKEKAKDISSKLPKNRSGRR